MKLRRPGAGRACHQTPPPRYPAQGKLAHEQFAGLDRDVRAIVPLAVGVGVHFSGQSHRRLGIVRERRKNVFKRRSDSADLEAMHSDSVFARLLHWARLGLGEVVEVYGAGAKFVFAGG